MICNRRENIDLLVPYIDKPVYVKGYCWHKTFDGWVVIYLKKERRSQFEEFNFMFDYKGESYPLYSFLPSEYTSQTSSTYNNAIYKEEVVW